MAADGTLLKAENLSKKFGRKVVLSCLDLSVFPHEVFGFLGPNGAGKTTFMRLALGLIRPNGGRIYLFGKRLEENLLPSLRRMGALIENPLFYPFLSGYENLKILAKLKCLDGNESIAQALDMVDLTKVQAQKVRTYSQGMRQRLGIAAAILGLPEFILLDEPTNGLDPGGMREVRNLIRSLCKDQGKTVFISSHLLHEVEQICDRVAIINEGILKVEGSVADLLRPKEGRVRIRCSREGEAAKLLRQENLCLHVEVEGETLYARTSAERPWEINAFLVKRGFEVSEFTPLKKNLEDFFLELTREEKEKPSSS